MCRMMAFSSEFDISVRPFFERLKHMAEHGKRSPHPDGWGFFCVDSQSNVYYHRSASPIFEDDIPDIKASRCIFHARKASPGTSKGIVAVHPFLFLMRGRIHAIAHNGSIKLFDVEKAMLKTGVDTEVLIQKIIGGGIESAPEEFKRRATSLTSLISDGERIVAFRCCWKGCDYYTLFLERDRGVVVVTSEGEGEEIQNGEMVVISRGEVVERKVVDCY